MSRDKKGEPESIQLNEDEQLAQVLARSRSGD